MSPLIGLPRALLGGWLLAAVACQSSSPSASEAPVTPPAVPPAPEPGQPAAGAGTYLTGALQVTAGHSHSCALVAGGAVYCWGESSQGQLGWGTWDDSMVPVRVHGIDDA